MFKHENNVQPTPKSQSGVTVHNRLSRFSLIITMLFVGSILAACGTEPPATEEVLAPETAATAVVPEPPVAEATAPAEEDVEVLVPTSDVTGQEQMQPVEVDLAEFNANPMQFLGQQVIVTGDLREFLGPRSFILNDPEAAGLDSTLVVGSTEGVIPTDLEPNIDVTNQVRVIGTVQEFDRNTLEQDLGYQFPDAVDDFAGAPSILADEVEVIGTTDSGAATQPTTATTGQMGQGAQIPEAAMGDFPFISVGQIDVDPAAYAGQRVTAWGEVDEQLGLNAYRVDEGNILDIAGEVLMIVPEGAPVPDNLQNETSIAVTGMVMNFVAADFERDYGFVFDDPGFEAEFENRPAIVADIVYTRASVSDIDDDAEAYIGNRVTVLGDVTEMVDPRTFRLDDPATLGGDDILVFIGNESMTTNVGDSVFVTGEVREFNREALATEYDYTWDDAVFDGFAENTVIVAQNIQVTRNAADAGVAADETGVIGGDAFGDNYVGISDIDADPQAYIGQQVTLNGEVSQVLGQNTIRMDEDNWLDIGDDILVILPNEVTQPTTLEDETNIVIQGTVQNFVFAEFERDYDFFTDNELYAEYENRPVVIADMLWLQATLSDVDDNPDAYLGNRVSVIGEASELIGVNAFRLEDPGFFAGDDVLVLMRDENMIVAEDARYLVTGTVQQFNLTDAEAELGYTLDENLFSGWTDRTVIIADSIQIRATNTVLE
ncbi:MAG: hypothetical protein HC822_02195 [Oscillochloris sp.]|nr:hypothetical protein [Oscillochloris sp.]